MNATALYGQISASVLVGAAFSMVATGWRCQAGILAAFVAFFSVAPLIYGLTGPLSLTLTQLALLKICVRNPIARRSRIAAALFIAFAAVFYPLALGLGPFDPFDLGYRPQILLIVMVPIGIWLAFNRQPVLLVIIGLDLIAYGAGLFDNLWNALFDPILVVVAAARLVLDGPDHTLNPAAPG